MTELDDPPRFPAGEFVPIGRIEPAVRTSCLEELAGFPGRLRDAVGSLSDDQLETKYRNWTIRQIANHLADSHANGYVRTKLALTEESPTIKPYDESRWSALEDAACGPIEPSLAILEGVHARWTHILRTLSDEQFSWAYFHPERNGLVRIDEQVDSYAWHARHHLAQIQWIKTANGW